MPEILILLFIQQTFILYKKKNIHNVPFLYLICFSTIFSFNCGSFYATIHSIHKKLVIISKTVIIVQR